MGIHWYWKSWHGYWKSWHWYWKSWHWYWKSHMSVTEIWLPKIFFQKLKNFFFSFKIHWYWKRVNTSFTHLVGTCYCNENSLILEKVTLILEKSIRIHWYWKSLVLVTIPLKIHWYWISTNPSNNTFQKPPPARFELTFSFL